MTEHTKTPFKGTFIYTGDMTVDGDEIINVCNHGLAFAPDKQTAQYIVKACNAYPKLVEALKNLIYYGDIHEVTGVVLPEGSHGEWLQKAKQLLSELDKEA